MAKTKLYEAVCRHILELWPKVLQESVCRHRHEMWPTVCYMEQCEDRDMNCGHQYVT